ncbi:MAG: hypothetical protein ABR607_08035 [Pyrinomonadaceae bacterium]
MNWVIRITKFAVLGCSVFVITGHQLYAQNMRTRSSAGAVSGSLKYPGDHLPAMRVYAISVDGKRHFRTNTFLNQPSFTIRGVPAGNYFLLAYTDEAPRAVGAWSRAVRCGLSIDCRDHSLIGVNVFSGRTATGVVVADWYADAGTFPPEPSAVNATTRNPAIRAVDFRNFSYVRKGVDILVLRDGRESGEKSGSRLLAVKYVDFDRDGTQEAFVTIGTGQREEGGYAEEYFVYSNRSGSLRQLFYESRQKPQSIRVTGQAIVITAPFWTPADSGCCPSLIETSAYSWRRAGFIRTSRQLRPRRP